MSERSVRRLITFIFAVTLTLSSHAQFYNGLQMTFGKNRVQYYDYFWSYYRFDDFDCYYNESGSDLARFTANYASKKLKEVEEYFDYTLNKRLIFVIYNKQAEYKQSNIGLVSFSDDEYNLGGYSRIIKNKVQLYYEGDHVAYEKQIAQSIVQVIVNEMLSNADVKDRTSSSSSVTTPDWYMNGLINYVAFGWDYTAENRVKDGFLSGKYKNITHLEYDDATYAGMSFWRFLAKQYGDALIPNIVYVTKIYKNINDGFLYIIGQKLKDLETEWRKYYTDEFSLNENQVSDSATVLRKPRKDQIIQQVRISPDNKYIAWVSNDWGRKKVWLYDQATEKSRIVFRYDPKYEHKTDNTYPVLAWHPNGKILTFVNEEKANLRLYFYRVNEKRTENRLLLYFDKVLDFAYAPEGDKLVFSAVKDGITDIYIHTIASGTNDQITRDVADDLNPSFLKNNPSEIIFTSNRLSDTLKNDGNPFEKLSLTFDLFTYDINRKPGNLTRLSEGQYNSRYMPVSNGKNRITYIGDNNGVLNRYRARFDSAVSFIDTATHYSYHISSVPVTNYNRNILNEDASDLSDTYGEVIFSKGKYQVRKKASAGTDNIKISDLRVTGFRKEQTRLLHKADSIERLRQWLITEDRKRRDTLKKPLYEYYVKNEPIDINHYIFEKEKQNYYEQLWRKDYMNIDIDTGGIDMPLSRIYQPSFYNNYIAAQIDFSFLNDSYQAYTGGAPYFNPGMNLMTKIGVLDLFENYKITGGFRFSGNFDSNEYLLSVENLKGKFDKQFIYHRQTFSASYSDSSGNTTHYLKIHSDNFYMSWKKAFTPVFALKGTVFYRMDRYVLQATDVQSLNAPDYLRHWLGLKGEVIYDNTRKKAINIYYGTRFKIFGEYYNQVQKKSDMIVLGADFRHYQKISRELIWANRFAISTSYGPTRLIYYLGGVDNWMGNLFSSTTMFDKSIPVSPRYNYGFQALATNMRGFRQNVRNGTSFAVLNSELRWPVIRYLVGHPLKSNFLNSLQVVGFGDLGSAWSGKSPWDSQNAYDTQVIKNGPVTVTLDTNRSPIVGGFGAGVRGQILGYFVRADWAWGVENAYILPRIFYLSFSLDF
jgi:Tol biopolymer transport system component